mmetsp:Transcript_36502/g.90545  ORF Transcript_36502/g.90545 Transcript_36502/m.90545 type:complete len:228 (-) Transcript_36502:2163-2846(-)
MWPSPQAKLSRASALGDDEATWWLGILACSGGCGFPLAREAGASLLRAAAVRGHCASQLSYSLVLARGLGAPQSAGASWHWWFRAARSPWSRDAHRSSELCFAFAEACAHTGHDSDSAVLREGPQPVDGWQWATTHLQFANPIRHIREACGACGTLRSVGEELSEDDALEVLAGAQAGWSWGRQQCEFGGGLGGGLIALELGGGVGLGLIALEFGGGLELLWCCPRS